MPELAEVETVRRSLHRLLRGKRITAAQPDAGDRIVFDQDPPERFRTAVTGARVTGTGRKGKYFWLELDRRPWPVFHLGMTGDFHFRARGGAFKRAWGGPAHGKREHDPKLPLLPFCRLRLTLSDGSEVAFTDPRRFGRIRLAQDPIMEPPISALGFDPLLSFPSSGELAALLSRRKAPIKAVLLDQSLFAGVGNWIADELLYQARVSPHRLASTLTAAEVARLRTKLLAIVRRAVEVGADHRRFPRSWLFHYRWGKEKDAKAPGKRPITHDTVGGRTTAWVPGLQK